jgi:hypothetical protein
VTSCDRVGGLNETRVEYLRGSRPAEDPHARGQEDVASCDRTGLKLSKRQKARSSPTPGGWKEVRRQKLAIVKGRGPAPRQGAGSTSSTSLYPKVLLLRSFENVVSSALTRDIEPPLLLWITNHLLSYRHWYIIFLQKKQRGAVRASGWLCWRHFRLARRRPRHHRHHCHH